MVTDGFQSRTSLRGVEPLLVRACRREPVERTPVWFMRQAGRSLPEYRELRKRYGLFDIVAEPELCAEVTLQPVRRHDVDAAVMFTDIMFPVLGMGVEVELVENVGPVIPSPIRTRADVDGLVVPDPEGHGLTILLGDGSAHFARAPGPPITVGGGYGRRVVAVSMSVGPIGSFLLCDM